MKTETARPFTPEDILDFRLVADLQISPDGRSVVYAVKTIDRARDRYDSRLWLVEDGGESRQLTYGPGNDSNPRWSHDGTRIAFVSTRVRTCSRRRRAAARPDN
jgi:dipeptidyl aminopeptidase/acylaminoacyl peptidase